mgnify:CR=1 FL=1
MKRLRIIYAIFLVLVIVTVIPSLISSLILSRMLSNSLRTQEQKYQIRAVVSLSENIYNYINSYSQNLKKISEGFGLAMEVSPNFDIFSYIGENQRILRYIQGDSNILAIWILNKEGKGGIVEPSELPNDIRRTLEKAHRIALEGKEVLGEPYFLDLPEIKQTVMVMAYPISSQGTIKGAICSLISLQKIYEDILRKAGKTEVAYVIDSKGKVVLHSQPSANVLKPSYENVEIVKKFMLNPNYRIRQTMDYFYKEGGKLQSVLGTIAPVNQPDWGVVVQKPEEEAYKSVYILIRQAFINTIVTFSIALILGYFLARALSDPLTKLAQVSEELARGNFKVRATIAGTKETSSLATSFNNMATQIELYIERLIQAATENKELFVNSIRMIATAIDAKDPYTKGHSERVCAYSLAIGKELGLSNVELEEIRVSAMLHDVGKIGIDDRVLRKPTALNEDEFSMIKSHPFKGAQIMEPVPQLKKIIPGIKYHHENWSGGGYPDGLKGEDIPLIARIIAISDTFDAMTTDRPYQKAMSPKYAAEKIRSLTSKRFDPKIVEAFLKAFEKGEIDAKKNNVEVA